MNNYPDYSRNKGLRLTRLLGPLRALPVRGTGRLTNLLAGLVPKPHPQGICLVSTIHGFDILVDPVLDRGLERALFNFGTYEEGLLRFMKALLTDGGTFLDVGANIGLMSLHAANIMGPRGRVISFEPLGSTYRLLLDNIEVNGFENITAENMAVGSADGTIEIYENTAVNRGSSTLIKPDQTLESHQTPICRLDDYLQEHPAENLRCMKVDVEGWELEVLKGARATLSSSGAPACVVECTFLHPTEGGGPVDIFRYFQDINDYRLFRLSGGKEKRSRLVEIHTEDDLPRHDNLFCLRPHQVDELGKLWFSG